MWKSVNNYLPMRCKATVKVDIEAISTTLCVEKNPHNRY